ncbi:MAG: reductive dehalogenase [Candidatus Latescibacteria bacterium]|jgi:reductive dehalogenase|nr:reductive dehalogenase [Candidatus Latescibacterota bacterium]
MAAYRITEELKRFNQRFTAFSRAKWDDSSAAYKAEQESRKPAGERRAHGYGKQDLALQAGAWAVARSKMQGPGAPGSDVQEMGVEDGETHDRYEPDDLGPLTRQVKDAASLYGADLVGIARVNPLWVYACNNDEKPIHLPAGVDTAVVMAVGMDYERIRTSPSAIAGAATGNGYSRMAFTGACVARYLTELGWRAKACGNDTALSIPLAIDAGLGEQGRNGLLITRDFGPRVRLFKVLTDAPLVPDEPDVFGVEAFCDVCQKCTKTCPSKSITPGPMTDRGPTPSNNPGTLKWYTNPDTCLAFWRRNGVSCANCIRSCPFNKPPGMLHDLARWLVRARSHTFDRALVLGDDLLGYGRAVKPDTSV